MKEGFEILLPKKGLCICYRPTKTLVGESGLYTGAVFWLLDYNSFERPDGPAITWYGHGKSYRGFLHSGQPWSWRQYPQPKIQIRFTYEN